MTEISSSEIFARQANVLKARSDTTLCNPCASRIVKLANTGTRWLHLHIFVLRPALLAALEGGHDHAAAAVSPTAKPGNAGASFVEARLLSSLANHCVQAAVELVDLTHGNYMAQPSALSPWWFNTYCASSPLSYLVKRTASRKGRGKHFIYETMCF
jgi:hypothetical protein